MIEGWGCYLELMALKALSFETELGDYETLEAQPMMEAEGLSLAELVAD